MFNDDFFPTPVSIVSRMVAPYAGRYGSLMGVQILEPSAGKGDIVETLIRNYRVKPQAVACIEVEPELQMILQQKGFRLIDTDFLNYGGKYHFDLIIMNPPFSAGAAHLLKAWEVVAPGGKVACLLNAETVLNPYSKERQLLRHVIDQHGSVEKMGACFKNAERPTAVEVVLVRLEKPQGKQGGIEFGGDFARDRGVADDEFQANPLTHANIIESLVAQYDCAAQLLVEQHEIEKKLRFYLSGVKKVDKGERDGQTINERLDGLKRDFWQYIFSKTRIGQQTTSQFQAKLTQFTDSTMALAFTMENIQKILSIFFLNKQEIMLECLESVFDKATDYHEKNRIHVEGWKTNKAYRVNSRVIMPYGVSFDPRWGSFSQHYGRSDAFFDDIDKVLCWLDGRSLESVEGVAATLSAQLSLFNRGEVNYQEPFESTYFKIRVFKKGTVHLDFKDKHLLDELNRRAAQRKGWRIGGGY